MNFKNPVFIGMFAGSTAGGIIASLMGADPLSMTSAIFSFLGGAVGIYIGYKLRSVSL